MNKRKLTSILIYLLLILAFFTCCSNNQIEKNLDEYPIFDHDETKSGVYKQSNYLTENYTISECPVMVPSGYDLGSIAKNSNNLYYLLSKPIEQGNFEKEAAIIELDLEKQNETTVYEWVFPKGGYVNELIATEEALFWVVLENGIKSIEMYNLDSRTKTQIETYQADNFPILLATDGRYVSWFESKRDGTQLKVFDSLEENLIEVCDKVGPQSLYTRAKINDGIISFISQRDDNKKELIVYNLDKKNALITLVFEDEIVVDNPTANKEYIAWSEGEFLGTNINIYGYDIGKQEFLLLNDAAIEEEVKVFSFDLLDHCLLINDRKTDQIVCRDLKKMQQSELTSALKGEHSYYLTSITADGCYIAVDTQGVQKRKIMYLCDKQ